jgi:dUTP pyrophosphatase
MRLAVRLLSASAKLPTRAYDGDAGFDLHADEPAMMAPGERATIGTGVAVELPLRHAGLVLPRSGLASRNRSDR